MLKRPSFASTGVNIDMTPMIDIVFQLLAFFIFTLRIVSQEGDLAIQMPLQRGPIEQPVAFLPPLQIHLSAKADGSLAEIRLNNERVADMPALRARVVEIIGGSDQVAAELEADLHCDETLAYQHTMAAVTAISGRRSSSGRIQPLIHKVRFK
ncbi:MAG: biopolymer transporter ExbD [Planctomycetales bacterium]|nr:biopolymer transporter ExbD [Planctomycetales bacterium]